MRRGGGRERRIGVKWGREWSRANQTGIRYKKEEEKERENGKIREIVVKRESNGNGR